MRWVVTLLAGMFVVGALAAAADARPGGGHSYSGGSHSYSGGSHSYSGGSHSYSGGSSSDGSIGGAGLVIVLAVFIVIMVIIALAEKEQTSTLTSAEVVAPANARDLQPLVTLDPAFSQVAFEDFVFQLYARVQRARGMQSQLVELTPYVATELLQRFEKAPPVSAVVIGSLRIVKVGAYSTNEPQSLDVRIEANLATPGVTVNSIERWTFTRHAGVKMRAPDRTRTFPCPNCNAPFTRGASERICASCGADIQPGRFDWTLTAMNVGVVTSVGPTLTGTVEEVGNDLVTVVDPTAYQDAQALYEADHNVRLEIFNAHVAMIYARLNTAWNAMELAPVRGLVTSSLLGYLQYWIDEYKRQGLSNKLDDAKVSRFALAKVARDPYFDAITVRVFADGLDFTVDTKGNVVGGSQSTRRAYTEYWTLIRSATRRGPVTVEPNCPNCGAPLSISDAGACTHCNAEVERGSFDWVLSKIEQDEVYVG